ncbi:DHHC palmitoyltransferase-domain-containing protein [Sporodiniella umbellata]|nr:DHHC palmitoyltransferase-domain-containing protein [Sporodiniella umbellata]
MNILSALRGPVVVIAVALMIAFFAYTSQIFVIWPYLIAVFNLTQTVLILLPLNFFIILTYVHYFLTCFTNPGSVPIRYRQRQQAYVEVKKSTCMPRFCKSCDNYKPPRAHHCSKCKRCVLKMDHHCPWINNCVGYFNYCHFIRFVVCVNTSCIYIFVLLCCRLNQVIKNLHKVRPYSIEIGFLSVNFICLAVVIAIVSRLNFYHFYYIATNTTTIEWFEKGRSLIFKGNGYVRDVKRPYHQGLYQNVYTVLGSPIFWLLPRAMQGTGLNFPISLNLSDHEEGVLAEKSLSSASPLARPQSAETFCSINNTEPLEKDDTQIPDRPTSFSTFVSNTTTLA